MSLRLNSQNLKMDIPIKTASSNFHDLHTFLLIHLKNQMLRFTVLALTPRAQLRLYSLEWRTTIEKEIDKMEKNEMKLMKKGRKRKRIRKKRIIIII